MNITAPLHLLVQEQLLEVCQKINQLDTTAPALEVLVQAACDLTCSQACSILVFEAETNSMRFAVAPHVQSEVVRLVRIPLEGSVAGECFCRGQPVLVQDAQTDARIFREVDRMLEFDTRNMVAIPLVFRNKVISVMEAVNKYDQNTGTFLDYTGQDETVLKLLATHAAALMYSQQLEEETLQARGDLDELERVKSDFIAITSNEMRAPVGLILGHAAMLNKTLQEAELKQETGIIVENALRLKKISDDLSAVERTRVGKNRVRRSKVDLRKLIEETVLSFEEKARRKRIRLAKILPGKSLIVKGDAEKLAVALGNLVNNALTFNKAGGHVVVTAEKMPGYVKVSVIDSGIGIPAKDLARVFDRFFQVETHMARRLGGIGLGLAVTKVMIEMHGGQIWAESMEGHGSKFSFLLPTNGVTGEIGAK